MKVKKCKSGGFHRQQNISNKVCVFCGEDVHYNTAAHAHISVPIKKKKPAYDFLLDEVIDAYSYEWSQNAKIAYPQDYSTEPNYKWFVTNTSA